MTRTYQLLSALIVVAIASAASFPDSSAYNPGGEYIYHYDGHVISGIPKLSKQYAGIKFDSKVRLQFLRDFTVVFKMEHVRVFTVDHVVVDEPGEKLDDRELTLLVDQQADIIRNQLTKPLKFRWDEGEIRQLEFENRDEYWSKNVKKGILTLLQVNLKGTNGASESPTESRLGSSVHHSVRPVIRAYSRLPRSDVNAVYKVVESDVTGECETKYTINYNKPGTSSRMTTTTTTTTTVPTMYVTAIRDLDDCVKKPHYLQGLFAGVYSDPVYKDFIHSMMHTDYVITGDRSNFIIQNAVSRGKYFVMPRSFDNGELTAYVYQNLRLADVDRINTQLSLEDAELDHAGLRQVIPQATWSTSRSDVRDADEDFRSSSGRVVSHLWSDGRHRGSSADDVSLTPILEQKMEDVIECIYSPDLENKTCPLLLMQFNRLLHGVSKEELKSLVKTYSVVRHESEHRKRQLLLDTMSTMPIPHVSRVVLELIHEGELTGLRAAMMIKKMSLLVRPTADLLTKIMEVYNSLPKKTEEDLDVHELKKSLLLACGTLGHRLMVVTKASGGRQDYHRMMTIIDSISREMKRLFDDASEDGEKELILKSLGNLGGVETFTIVKQVIENRQLSDRMRLNAMYATRRVPSSRTHQVKTVMLNVYMDAKESAKVRIGAFVMLYRVIPSYITLQAIAHRLRTEPSSQVRSFVYTSLVGAAELKTVQPEYLELVKNARLVLKMLPPMTVGIHDSFTTQFQTLHEDGEFGATLKMMKLKSEKSWLPKSFVASLHAILYGKSLPVTEFGIESQGFEHILRRIVGPNGVLRDLLNGKVSVKDLIKPFVGPDVDGIPENLRKVLDKLASHAEADEEFLVSWYRHVLGNELHYMTITPKTAEALIKKVNDALSEVTRRLTEGWKIDVFKTLYLTNSLVIASPIGIPLTLNHTINALFKVDGVIKLNNLPRLTDLWHRRPAADLVSLDVDLKPSLSMYVFGGLGVDMKWLTGCAAYEVTAVSHVPVKVKTTVDLQSELLSAKVFLPKKKLEWLKLSVFPLTVVKVMSTALKPTPFKLSYEEMAAEKFAIPVNFQKTWQSPLTGTKLQAIGHYSKCGPNWCPSFPLYGKHELKLALVPDSATEYVEWKLKTSNAFNEERFNSEIDDEVGEDGSGTPYHRQRTQSGQHIGNRLTNDEDTDVIDGDEIAVEKFDRVKPDSIFLSKPHSRRLLITAGTNRGQNEIKAKITIFLDRTNLLKHQFNFQLISSFDGLPKINVNNIFNPNAILPSSQSNDSDFIKKFSATWKLNEETKQIKLKIVPGDKLVSIKEELIKHGIESAAAMESRNNTYKYTVDIDFSPNMGRRSLDYVTRVVDWAKYKLFKYDTLFIPTHPVGDKVVIVAQFLPRWEKVTVIVKTPTETNLFVDAPFIWNPFLPKHENLMLHDTTARQWDKDADGVGVKSDYECANCNGHQTSYFTDSSRECAIDSDKVDTFDDHVVSMSEFRKHKYDNCEFVFVRDVRGLITITGSTSSGNMAKATLKAFAPKLQLELHHSSSSKSIRVNGQTRRLSTSQPIVIADDEGDQQLSKPLYRLEKVDDYNLLMTFFELGLTLSVDVKPHYPALRINLSPLSMLHGGLRGLCGNYNQDASDDLSSNLTAYSDAMQSLKEYMIPSEHCSADIEHIEPAGAADTEDNKCMVSDTMTIRRRHNDVDLVCTSSEPVVNCASNCHLATKDSWKWTTVCFTCHYKDRNGELFTEEIGENRRSELLPHCPKYGQLVELPTECLPNLIVDSWY